MSRQLNVLFSSLKMAIATLCSRLLGLVREQVLAFYFGASGFTDAFLIAYRIPNLLRDLFAEGAFSAAFVPVFVEARGVSPTEARKLLWKLFILLGLVTLTIGVITFVFAPEIINVFAPTFHKDPEKFELTVLLTRIMSPFLCFVSMAALFMGALNSLKVFFLPSFAPAFFNISMIISMLVFPSWLIARGLNPIISAAMGVFIGGLVQAFVQLPLVIKKGYGPTHPGKLLSQQSKKVFKKLGPGLFGFAATQLNLIVNTILASMSAVGAVSWLSFAFRLFQFPVGILSVSIGNSNLVHFSDAWKNKRFDEARDYLATSYFMSLLVVFPAMAALIIFSDEMVNVIFEHGQFTTFSREQTAKALRWYALGLPFYSIYKIFVPSFYTLDREMVPVLCSIGSIIFNIIFCVTLAPQYGFEVLALGTTISIFLNSCMQGIILKKDVGLSWRVYFNWRVLKLLISLCITSFIALKLKLYFDFMSHIFIERASLLILYLAIIAMSYFLILIILGERTMVNKLIRRIMRK